MHNRFRSFMKYTLLFLVVLLIGRVAYLAVSSGEEEITGSKVAVIKMTGIIYESDSLIEKLKEYEKNDNIKGIIIRVNSPGGLVTPSQELYNYILTLKKPVYAAMGSVAASGGYYLALAANKVYAMPSTVTGSIGVIMNLSNHQELMDKIGIESKVIKSGKFKDIGSPNREMTEEEEMVLGEVVMDMYEQFVQAVSSRRNLPEEEVRIYADGRIFTGRMAKDYGLIDRLGSYRDAFVDMKNQLNIDTLELYEPKEKKSVYEQLMEGITHISNRLLAPMGLYYLADI